MPGSRRFSFSFFVQGLLYKGLQLCSLGMLEMFVQGRACHARKFFWDIRAMESGFQDAPWTQTVNFPDFLYSIPSVSFSLKKIFSHSVSFHFWFYSECRIPQAVKGRFWHKLRLNRNTFPVMQQLLLYCSIQGFSIPLWRGNGGCGKKIFHTARQNQLFAFFSWRLLVKTVFMTFSVKIHFIGIKI